MPSPKYRYWLITVPYSEGFATTVRLWEESGLPELLVYVKGQQERGAERDYHHFQLLAVACRQITLGQIKRSIGGTGHCEPSRSDAADAYVWKDDTAVPDSRFEIGVKPVRRNSRIDWERVKDAATRGALDEVPASVYVQHYRSLRAIHSDNQRPVAMVRSCSVFWGVTGVGKSRRAWDEAGLEAYSKDPRTKWWCGYRGQEHVILDEFTGKFLY